MLPEVKEFLDTVEALDKEIERLDDMILAGKTVEERRERREAWRIGCNMRTEKMGEAAVKLAEDTENALIKHIAENHLEYHSTEAMDVLKVADQGFKAMDAVATEQNWCSSWTDAVQDAVDAGVLELSNVEMARFKLRRELASELGSYEAAEVMELVDKLIIASVAEATENLVKTAEVAVNAVG